MPDHISEPSMTSDDLSRSYAALVGDEAWQQDLPPDVAEPPTVAVEAGPPPPPHHIIEALLFVGGAPSTAKRACGILRGLSEEQFEQAIAQLNADYRRQGRPYFIQPHEHGWVLTLRPRYRNVIEKLYGGVREARLSTAAIDVLALVAYRQPVSKSDVDSWRGGDSGALLRQLVRRGLIQVVQRRDTTQKEVAYGTTQRFLDLFALQSLDDLPKTHDLQQL